MTNRSLRVGLVCLICAPVIAAAQGNSVLTGTIVDADSQRPVEDVLVTVTSPSMPGEQLVVSDAAGLYRLPNLPPGIFTLRAEREGFRPYSRGDIQLSIGQTVRFNLELLPEAITETIVVSQAPTVDVGASSTGVSVGTDFVNRLPLVSPAGKNAASRSFESLAETAPGAYADDYGVSISGTTSPENLYVIDGLSVNDPGFGLLGTPLSLEFVREVAVKSGGYLPEHGRSSGGIVEVVTKSGGNETFGSVWLSVAPGFLASPGADIARAGGTIGTRSTLHLEGDVGAEVGGALIRDRLWYYAGVAPALSRTALDRSVRRLVLCRGAGEGCAGAGAVQLDGEGFPVTERIEGTDQRFFATQRTLQYLGKLTYLLDPDHSLTLSVYGAPQGSGGGNDFGVSWQGASFQGANGLNGQPDALRLQYYAESNDVALKWSSAFAEKRYLLDVTLGWHHQRQGFVPPDGSEPGGDDGLAARPQIYWNRSDPAAGGPHAITEFETLPDPSACDPLATYGPGASVATLCPVLNYVSGGPGWLEQMNLDSFQARALGTALVRAGGHHVWKAGAEVTALRYENRPSYSGQAIYTEDGTGQAWLVQRGYMYLFGPDALAVRRASEAASTATTIGAFLQDSWSVLDLFTLNAGIRVDTQSLFGANGRPGLILANQWAPRVGIVYDFTQQGRSKLYGNFARYYQNMPLDVMDRLFPGHPQVFAIRAARASGAVPSCDPTDAESLATDCRSPDTAAPISGPNDPNQRYFPYANELTPVDPDIVAESLDEIVVGGEYEPLPRLRVGVSYTRRRQNDIVEDMSANGGATYFLGNPGRGIAGAFPKPVRDYDGLTVSVSKGFSDSWLLEGSYTWSRLVGNYSGLYRPETLQLNPNNSSDFDIEDILPNRSGYLPNDRRHQFKVYASRELRFDAKTALTLGLAYRGLSGRPLNTLGSHPLYGQDEVFILPRGSAGRLPFVHTVDLHVGLGWSFAGQSRLSVWVDAFNLLNLQTATRKEETYTFDNVGAIEGGSADDLEGLTTLDGNPAAVNPDFLKTIATQPPRSFRAGVKVSF